MALLAITHEATSADLPAGLTLSGALNIALSHGTVIREGAARLDQASGQYQQARGTPVKL